MKTLYFVGNEELWNNAWFLALVESLKSRSMNVVLLDCEKDSLEIKSSYEKLTAYERLVFNKGMYPLQTLQALGVEQRENKLESIFLFAEILNANASPKQVSWGAEVEEFVKTIGMGELSQVNEDAFIFDTNVAGELSRAIEQNDHSLVDEGLLSADAEQMAQMINDTSLQGQESAAVEFKTEILKTEIQAPKEEIQLDDFSFLDEVKSDLNPAAASEEFNMSLELGNEEEAPNDTKIIVPVQASETAIKEVHIEKASGEEHEENHEFSEAAIPVGAPSVEVSQLISAMSPSVSREDMEVLKRYSSLKERELRESQAASEALRKQIRYFDERLKKSEEDRRKLLLKLEELDNELRTTSDKKDENRAQLRSIENRYEEKIKELLVQLESSQFQVGKLDKKLTDFRERVRNDLQKIRSRERELASRLEIQKRDAEALLSAKDERLLNQKREMDRFEFDLDSLKERLLDDAQKGEERRKRVARALQSLKLAQSILSGLEEDIVTKDEKDKAA